MPVPPNVTNDQEFAAVADNLLQYLYSKRATLDPNARNPASREAYDTLSKAIAQIARATHNLNLAATVLENAKVGKLQFVRQVDARTWLGKEVDDARNRDCIVLTSNLAPGEKLAVRTINNVKCIVVESYGGVIKHPTYTRMAEE